MSPSDDSLARANHLQNERSLYLRQHASNPVDWYPWGEEALARARTLDRPVFLSVGYASCHWCHVMEREVFTDEAVARLLNARFVPIKLDREERPDLDAVYMEALQALTGGGGWPMSLFLTADLRPFYGETYMPRPRFLEVAATLADLYRDRRVELDAQAALLARRVRSEPETTPGDLPDREAQARVVAQARSYFDETWGGFKGRMKFPTPPRFAFLLHQVRRTGDTAASQMVRTTLDAMASGGLRDQVGGGFHRYTVEPTWLVPHFEKMLYDNAQLARLFTEAAGVFANEVYAQTAREALDFMVFSLQNPEGGFAASLDADSEGQEGLYYLWTPADLCEVAGDRDGRALAILLGVTESGHIDGRSVLSRRVPPETVAQHEDLDLSEAHSLFSRYRPALLAKRQTRPAPTLDRKVVTSWNGLALSALAAGFSTFSETRYWHAARRAADFLWQVHEAETGLRRSSDHGVPGPEAVLGDYALFALGLLDLYDAGQDSEHLRRALLLLDIAQDRFAHAEAGYYQTPADRPTPLGRRIEFLDSVRPSENAAMAQLLWRAAALTGRPAYRAACETLLRAYGPWMRRFGLEMAAWHDAAARFMAPVLHVVIAGAPDDPRTQALLTVYRRQAPEHAVLFCVPPEGPDPSLASLAPIVAEKTAKDGCPTAYLCTNQTCQAPLTTPETLAHALGSL